MKKKEPNLAPPFLEPVAVEAPVLSLPSGVNETPQSVVVTGEDGSELHYTLDGDNSVVQRSGRRDRHPG